MNLNTLAVLLCAAIPLAAAATPTAADNDGVCGALIGTGKSPAAANSGFQLREGEPVDFVGGGKTVHGVLHVFHDGDVYRVYWQPDGSHEKYVFANAGSNRIQLISTPPRGVPANPGEPGSSMPVQKVESCPQL
jgi:hypothetical protein